MKKIVFLLLLTLGSLSAMDDGEHCDTPYTESTPRVVHDLSSPPAQAKPYLKETSKYHVSIDTNATPEERYEAILRDHIPQLDQHRTDTTYTVMRLVPDDASKHELYLYKDCQGDYFAFYKQIFEPHQTFFSGCHPPVPVPKRNGRMNVAVEDVKTNLYVFNDHGTILIFHKRLAYIKKR